MRSVLLLALFVVLPFGSVFAEEVIPSFDARIIVHEDASIEVAEQVVYDFGEKKQHGIFRVIPFSYQANATTYTADISKVSVYDGAKNPLPFTESRGNGELTLKIGDPETMVTGLQTYVIGYTVQGPFLYLGDQDELYWNVTGSWTKPITRATVLVDLPRGTKVLGAKCYQGAQGSKRVCDKDERLVNSERAGYTAVANNLTPSEGLTVAVAFPKGTIAQPKKPWASGARIAPYTYTPLLLPVVVFFAMLYLWYTRGRDPEGRTTIVTQFEPPKGMLPSIAGIVYNERIESREISAEIVRLAVEGYLRIHRIEKAGLVFTSTDYLFERVEGKGDPADVVATSILSKLFKERYAGEGEVEGRVVKGALLSKMHHTFTEDRAEITSVMYDEVFARGYFLERPDTVRNWYIATGIASVVAGILLAVMVPQGLFTMLGVAIVLSGIPVALVGVWMPVKTRAGVALKEYLEGFKRYLSVAEKDRLTFHHAPDIAPAVFDRYLPFAMAFGIEKAWAEQFKDLHVPKPEWYSGPVGTTFVPAVFVSDLSAFSSDFATASMPVSSGAHGGGSVGGGFGGGGGGSW